VSAGVCTAGRADGCGFVTARPFVAAGCASAEIAVVTIIKAAAIVARMTAFVSVETALESWSDAFSSREPDSTSLENAILKHICVAGNSGYRFRPVCGAGSRYENDRDDAERRRT
jgi:hypothetical protein